MIVTVTFNPAIDKTIQVDELLVNKLNRLDNIITDVGGKGINVSKVIKELGGESLLTGFLAGNNGLWIEEELNKLGLNNHFKHIDGNTRVNLKILDRNMNLTELNEVGSEVMKEDLLGFENNLLTLVNNDDVVVFCGSVPKNVPKNIYASLITKVKNIGAKVILDADGELFDKAIEAGPLIIKPNRHELCKYFKLDEEVEDDVLIHQASKLLDKGIKLIVLSLGANGSVFITKDIIAKVDKIKVKTHSSVGAGDAMVGALAYGIINNFEIISLIKLAVATSVGAVMTKGTKAPNKSVIEELMNEVKIELIER